MTDQSFQVSFHFCEHQISIMFFSVAAGSEACETATFDKNVKTEKIYRKLKVYLHLTKYLVLIRVELL